MGETWNESRELPRCPGKKKRWLHSSHFCSLACFLIHFVTPLHFPSLPFPSHQSGLINTLPSFFYFTSPSCTSTSTSNTKTSPLFFCLLPLFSYLLLTLSTFFTIPHHTLHIVLHIIADRGTHDWSRFDQEATAAQQCSYTTHQNNHRSSCKSSHCIAWHGMSCHHIVCCVVLCSAVLLDTISYIDSPLCLLYPPPPSRPLVLQLPSWFSTSFTSSPLSAYPFISSFILLLLHLLLLPSLYLHIRVCTYWLYVQRKESIRNQAEAAWQLTKNEKKYVSITSMPYHAVTVSTFFIDFVLSFWIHVY